MKIDQPTSLKIDALRFPLICSLLFLNMGENYCDLIITNHDLLTLPFRYIIYLFSNIIPSSAIGFFFTISGFLFFNTYQPTWECYWRKLKPRVTTLLIPYLFWNLFFLLIKLIFQLNRFSTSLIVGSGYLVAYYTAFDYFNVLFSWTDLPAAPQLWLLRDLIILVILAPVIWFLTKKFSALILIVLLLLWCFNTTRFINIHPESLFFFTLGCFIAQKNFNLNVPYNYPVILLKAYGIFALIAAGLAIIDINIGIPLKLLTIFGVFVFWYSSDLVLEDEEDKNSLLYMYGYSFFIYAASEPLLSILVRLISKISFLQNYLVVFLLYCLMPIFIIFLLWLVGKTLKERIPALYQMIGGRQEKPRVF